MKTTQALLTALALTLLLAGANAQSWTTNTLPPGLVAWWQAEGTFLDSVGTNHGAPVGGVTFAAGHAGESFAFSGTNQGVIIPYAASLDVPSSGFTVEFWMKAGRDQPEGISSIVDKDHSANDNTGWTVSCWRDTGRLSFGIGDGVSFPLCTNLTDVLDNQFHHVAFAWDKTNWLIYVNGVLENGLYRPAVVNNTRPLRFGYHWEDGTSSPMRYFKGFLDEVRLYNRALTAGEVAYLYQGPTLPVTNGLKVHFDAGNTGGGTNPAEGASVTPWRDLGGLGLDATPLFGVAPVYRVNALNGRAGVDFAQSGADDLATAYSSQFAFTNCTIIMVGNGAGLTCHVSISAPCVNQEFAIGDKAIYHHAYPFHYSYRSHQDSPANYYVQAGVFGVQSSQLDNWINGVLSTNGFGLGQQSPTLADVADYTPVARQAMLGWRNSDAYCNAPIALEDFGGVICEVLVYDRQLTTAEVDALTLYLAGKYRLDVSSLPPTLQVERLSASSIALSWESTAGKTYQLQSATNLPAAIWQNEGVSFSGTGGVLTTNLPISSAPVKFFRLRKT